VLIRSKSPCPHIKVPVTAGIEPVTEVFVGNEFSSHKLPPDCGFRKIFKQSAPVCKELASRRCTVLFLFFQAKPVRNRVCSVRFHVERIAQTARGRAFCVLPALPGGCFK